MAGKQQQKKIKFQALTAMRVRDAFTALHLSRRLSMMMMNPMLAASRLQNIQTRYMGLHDGNPVPSDGTAAKTHPAWHAPSSSLGSRRDEGSVNQGDQQLGAQEAASQSFPFLSPPHHPSIRLAASMKREYFIHSITLTALQQLPEYHGDGNRLEDSELGRKRQLRIVMPETSKTVHGTERAERRFLPLSQD